MPKAAENATSVVPLPPGDQWLPLGLVVLGAILVLVGVGAVVKNRYGEVNPPSGRGGRMLLVALGILLVVAGIVVYIRPDLWPSESAQDRPSTSPAAAQAVRCTSTTWACLLKPEAVAQAPSEATLFVNGGGSITARPVDACHRPERSSGYEITWDNRTAEASSGWVLDWSHKQAPPSSVNLAGFRTVNLSVQGVAGTGTFQIGLKDVHGAERKVESQSYAAVLSSRWAKVTVPLAEFGPVDLGSVLNLNLGFNQNHGSGRLCLDEISFE